MRSFAILSLLVTGLALTATQRAFAGCRTEVDNFGKVTVVCDVGPTCREEIDATTGQVRVICQ